MTSSQTLDAAAYRKVDWRLIPFLFLCYIVAYLDRVNVGFAKLQMSSDLSLSDAAFATGAGIFFIGYFFFEVPSNIALKKYGARMWIMRIMVTWGIVSCAMMFVRGEWSFYGMRFILGLAEAGFFPGVIYYLTIWYPSDRRSTRTAWFVTAIPLAGVIGNPISGAVMDLFSGALRARRLAMAVSDRGRSVDHRRHLGDVLPRQQHRRSEMADRRREDPAQPEPPGGRGAEDRDQHPRRVQERQGLCPVR